MTRTVAIDRIRLLAMGLGIIHMGIGGRVDDQLGTLTHRVGHLLRLGDVQLCPRRGQHIQSET